MLCFHSQSVNDNRSMVYLDHTSLNLKNRVAALQSVSGFLVTCFIAVASLIRTQTQKANDGEMRRHLLFAFGLF